MLLIVWLGQVWEVEIVRFALESLRALGSFRVRGLDALLMLLCSGVERLRVLTNFDEYGRGGGFDRIDWFGLIRWCKAKDLGFERREECKSFGWQGSGSLRKVDIYKPWQLQRIFLRALNCRINEKRLHSVFQRLCISHAVTGGIIPFLPMI